MMPDDFRDALIVSLYKKKGSKSDCGNYRGISLLSVAGKIFARVILNRFITVPEQEHCRHDIHYETTSREVHRLEQTHLLSIH